MSLHVNDTTLVDNLLERHTPREVFSVVAKVGDLPKSQIKLGIIDLIDKLELDLEDLVKLCLATKKGKEHTNELTSEFFEQIFDTVWEERHGDFDSAWKFEHKCYPKVEHLIDKINQAYLGADPVLEAYDNDDLINYLEDTNDFDEYLENYKSGEYDKGYEDACHDQEEELEDLSNAIIDADFLDSLNPDAIWEKICNQARCGYYDKKSIVAWIEKLKEKLDKSSYSKLIEREEKNGNQ